MNLPTWLKDIAATADSMPFGSVTLQIKRHRNRTTKLDLTTHSSIKYTDTPRAFSDIEQLMNNMIEGRFTGTLQFEQTYQDGRITAITIKNKKTINYRDK